ncbi:MAG: tRNA lysidine(34) synthetase TilS [Planctomycetaceae bacterium]
MSAAELRLELHVAHVDHQWRDDSCEDAAAVARLAERLQLPFHLHSVKADDVSSLPPHTEAAARDARRRYLGELSRELSAAWVAVGHTRDDQVETVLHRVLRGTGVAGLSGIRPVSRLSANTQLVRPLLDCRREEVEAYLRSIGVDWCVDDTNRDGRFTRNRIRHDLLPELRDKFNPQVDAALERLAAQAAAIYDWLAGAAGEGLRQAIIECQPNSVTLDATTLRAQPVVVVSEMLRLLWRRQAWPEQAMGSGHWDKLTAMAQQTTRSTHSLPGGMTAECSRDRLLITARQPSETETPL